MEWFFGLDQKSVSWFNPMVRVAVTSALAKTTLRPHCLFDGEPCALTHWLGSMGVIVHFTAVPFRGELFSADVIAANAGSHYDPEHAAGAFLRTIVWQFATDPVVLYTDCDVMFMRNLGALSTSSISAAFEVDAHGQPAASSFNSGVMLINVAHFRSEFDGIVARLRDNQFYSLRHKSYDQSLLNAHFAGRWDRLDRALNWRPFQGINEAAAIVHWHGPKPRGVAKVLSGAPSEDQSTEPLVHGNLDAYRHYLSIFDAYATGGKVDLAAPSIAKPNGQIKLLPPSSYGADYVSEFRRILADHLRLTKGRVLEWGSGHTTGELIQHLSAIDEECSLFLTIDDYPPYVEELRKSLGPLPRWVEMAVVSRDGPMKSQSDPELAYSTYPLRYGKFDFIFIDGRRRMECAFIASLLCHKDSIVVIHDYRRGRYQPIKALFDVLEDGPQFRVLKPRIEIQRALRSQSQELIRSSWTT